MNIKTEFFEEYMIFVDVTKKQNKYFKTIMFSIAIIITLFFFFYLNIIQSSICTILIMNKLLFVFE